MGQNRSQFQEYKREQKLRQNSEKIHGLTRVLRVTDDHKTLASDPRWANQEQKKQCMKMLKNVFGQLDPSVVHQKGSNCGQVELSVKYDKSQSLLLVRVNRCEDLRSQDVRSKACNPLVTIRLFPDTDQEGEKSTEVSPLTCNPVYGELFAYKLPSDLLEKREVFIEVWDRDINYHDEFLGQSFLMLSDLPLLDGSVHTFWTPLQIKSDLQVSGDLDISLSYEDAVDQDDGEEEPRLSITVHQATGLKKRHENQNASPFVTVMAPGTLYSFRTKAQLNTSDPVWEETFQCAIPRKDFSRRFLLFEVVDSSEPVTRPLGQVVITLGEIDPDCGQPVRVTYSLADLTNSDLLQEKLAQEPATQELRGALQAHAMNANPSFIFQKPAGNKTITLTARKARSQAKIRIQDGIPVY